MTYNNKVDNKLLCKHCEGRLDIPKILPCGETICSFCGSSIQVNDRMFDCLICKDKHEIPKNPKSCKNLVLKMVLIFVKKHFMDLRSDVQLAAEEVIQQS